MRMTKLAVLGLVAALSACGDSTGTGSPGTFLVSLETPNSDDGAVAVTIVGTGLTNVTSVGSSNRLYWRLVSATEMRVLVFGSLAAGPLFSVDVGDVRHPDRYAGTVTEVARRNDEQRGDLVGYTISFAKAAAP